MPLLFHLLIVRSPEELDAAKFALIGHVMRVKEWMGITGCFHHCSQYALVATKAAK